VPWLRGFSVSLLDAAKDLEKAIRNGTSHRWGHLWRRFSLRVLLRGVEACGFNFAEKLVLSLDYAYIFYNYNIKPRLLVHSTPSIPRRKVQVQVYKRFSGDVSGCIGEALFAYIAINRYGVRNIFHLRPAKSRYLAPDFLVVGYNDIRKLGELIGLPAPPKSVEYLFVECKACASDLVDYSRIKRGLCQLAAMMDNDSLGLLFMLHKPDGITYRVHTIGLTLSP